MTQVMADIARATAGGKMVITLEGGYDIAGQRRSVKSVLTELSHASPIDKSDLPGEGRGRFPTVLNRSFSS